MYELFMKPLSPRILISTLVVATLNLQSNAADVTSQNTQRADSILNRMTLEQKIDYIGGTGFGIRGFADLGIPAFEMSDGPLGVRSNLGFQSTVYAGGIGLAATWNRQLAEKVGDAIGKDARARGIHFMLGPGVNIYRFPLNSRNYEYFGEDPFLAASIAVGYIRGMQANDVSATVKHYAANNSEYMRHEADATIDERTLREIYLYAFEAAVKQARVGAVMDAYNPINGDNASQNAFLNTMVLRKDWGFQGVLMSDWISTYNGVAAASSGLDLEMPYGSNMNRKNLLPAIQDGRLTTANIDEKVRHILQTADRFHWLDHAQQDRSLSVYNEANHQVALQTARESIVLLKNNGNLLPLDRAKVKSILVVGPNAYPAQPVAGGSGAAIPFSAVSLLEGIGQVAGPDTTTYYQRGLPTLESLVSRTKFVTAPAGGQPGLRMDTFANYDVSGTPSATAVVPQLNFTEKLSFELGAGGDFDLASFLSRPKSPASHRWTGYYVAEKDGLYKLVVQGPGEKSGYRVYVDDKLLVDEWIYAKTNQNHRTLTLSAGPHKIVAESFCRNPWSPERLRLAVVAVDQLVDPAVKQLAANADVVVVTAGFSPDSESEGTDRTYALPFGQDELIETVMAENQNTIVTVTSGGAVDTRRWLDHVPAYLHLWYGGEKAGTALGEVLYGIVNPSGRLPATFGKQLEDYPTAANYYPKAGTKKVEYKEGVFVGYRGFEENHIEPLYAFGYGLSYTTFKFDGLAVKSVGTAKAPGFEVVFSVTNTGTRAGATVAQVYVGEKKSRVPRPAKELKGFVKVELQPGETRSVSVPLDMRSFAYFDTANHQWRADDGAYHVMVGSASNQIELQTDIKLAQTVTAKP